MRRTVTFLGLAVMASGVWTLQRTYAVIGICRVLTSSATTSGIDRVCSRTIFAYVEGFVLVSSGLFVVMIAVTMIDRQRRIDLRSELRAVPRQMSTPPRTFTNIPSIASASWVQPGPRSLHPSEKVQGAR